MSFTFSGGAAGSLTQLHICTRAGPIPLAQMHGVNLGAAGGLPCELWHDLPCGGEPVDRRPLAPARIVTATGPSGTEQGKRRGGGRG